MISLRVKFTLALLVTSLLAILLVGFIARYVLLQQFHEVLFRQSFRAFKTDVAAYHLTYGSLEKARKAEPFRQFEMRRHALDNDSDRNGRDWRDGLYQAHRRPPGKLRRLRKNAVCRRQ